MLEVNISHSMQNFHFKALEMPKLFQNLTLEIFFLGQKFQVWILARKDLQVKIYITHPIWIRLVNINLLID